MAGKEGFPSELPEDETSEPESGYLDDHDRPLGILDVDGTEFSFDTDSNQIIERLEGPSEEADNDSTPDQK